MRNYIIALLSMVSCLVGAQSTIYGTVTDEIGTLVEGADVFVDGTDYYYYTEADGSFVIEVEPGTYTFTVSAFGFDEYTKEIEIGENVKLEWLPTITSQSEDGITQELEGIVVQAEAPNNESEVSTLKIQRKSVEIREVKGAEELSRLGKSDAAQAVSAIAGVSKQEGTSNVYVRGLGDRYLSTTLNGLFIPSNDVNKKNIDLDLFSSDIIQSVSISKAYAAGFNGDFAAGNVDIASKEHTGKDYIRLSVGSRINTNSLEEDFVQSEGTNFWGYYGRYNDNPWATAIKQEAGTEDAQGIPPFSTNASIDFGKSFRFENNAKLSFFGTASFTNGYDFLDGEEQNFAASTIVAFPNVKKYSYTTTTNAMTSAVMRFNSKHKLKYNTLFINSSNDQVGYYGYKGMGSQRDVNGSYFQQNIQFNQDLIWVNQLEGEHKLADKWTMDWAAGYNILQSNEPDRKRYTLTNYENLLDSDDSTLANFRRNTSFDNQRYSQDIDDSEINARFHFNYALSDNIKINFGGKTRYKDRDFENIRIGYDLINNQIGSLDDITEFFGPQNWLINYNTQVLNPISIDDENGENVITLDPKNMPGLPENTYSAYLVNFGTYVDFEWTINDKLLIVPGLRFEDFKQKIEWNVNNLAFNNPGEKNAQESLLLPSLNIKYSLQDDMNFRFSASNTVSFPEFKEFAPFVYEGVTQRIGGNPDVLGHSKGVDYTNVEDVSYSNIYNFDLKYEWFFSKKELISIAAFYKQIQDPINLVVGASATGDEYYFRTGEKAEVYGLEIDARKDIVKSGHNEFFVGFNGSYMDTQQDLYSSIVGTRSVNFNRSEEELQGASNWIFNADINFATQWGKIKPTFTVVGNYFSDRIFSLGSGSIGNKMEKGVPTLDFLIATEFGKNAKLKLGAKNLLNPDYEIYRETSQSDVTLSKYKIGRIITLGLEFKF